MQQMNSTPSAGSHPAIIGLVHALLAHAGLSFSCPNFLVRDRMLTWHPSLVLETLSLPRHTLLTKELSLPML